MENYYTYTIYGITYFVKTNKKRANDIDAKRILDLWANKTGKNLNDYDNKLVENTLKQIKYGMNLCTIKRYDNGQIGYHGKYSGGITGKTENEDYIISEI